MLRVHSINMAPAIKCSTASKDKKDNSSEIIKKKRTSKPATNIIYLREFDMFAPENASNEKSVSTRSIKTDSSSEKKTKASKKSSPSKKDELGSKSHSKDKRTKKVPTKIDKSSKTSRSKPRRRRTEKGLFRILFERKYKEYCKKAGVKKLVQ